MTTPDTPHQPFNDRRQQVCKHESTLAGLTHDRDSMKQTLEAVSTKLDLILAQITKVAILEERHTNSAVEINKAHSNINLLKTEVDVLSKEVREFINQTKGMTKMAWAIWTILSGGMGMMLAKLFFFTH
jgi:multidrug resistance efflux pump